MFRLTDILFSVAAKVDSVAPMKNHFAGAVKDKLLRELEGRTGRQIPKIPKMMRRRKITVKKRC